MKENFNTSQENTRLKEQLKQYFQYWPWFLLSIIICISLAYLKLRYSTYNYITEATILIKDDRNASLSEIAVFEDLGLTGSSISLKAEKPTTKVA